MSLGYWIGAVVLAFALWWFGFIATKQMRIDKNRERTERWEKMAAAQKLRRELEALEKENTEQQASIEAKPQGDNT
ncbi:MAG: hypothetical protein AUK35_10375 [Zetaproteobacteria bacterium CG2_30_46_52]|nr:MAG: hypothetical protein AUK35_10375 [Zetaproteobacteria bacterium CG2_30_46_52]